jgi:hypothetical protein
MGATKAILALQEQQRDAAIGIAIKTRVLRVCEFHGEVFAAHEFIDLEPAYRRASRKFKRGEFGGLFESQRELTDEIKEAVNEFCWDECPYCWKMLKD